MPDSPCPDRDTLQQLLLGKLAGEAAEQLEEHLLQCDDCAQVAETVPVGDELTVALQGGEPTQEVDELLAEAIEQGKKLRSEIETVQSEETVLAGRRDEQDEPRRPRESFDPSEIDFLLPPEEPDEIGRLGGYRVLEVLGVGGMGVVFLAEDPRLKRPVALKAMKPAVAASNSAKERFLKEAEATAAIEHDHIVTIYQVGEDRGIPFIAMRYLRGESLQARLDREHRLDQREVVRLGRQIALGLAAAHERGLVHRDVKPDNIWLDSKQGRVKIVDFGLVRSTSQDAGLTQSGMVVGTPKYMAPEQAEGASVDHRCDLFSLGSVLYHLASGKPPFEGPNITSTLLAVAQANPTPIATRCPQLHSELSALIMRLLSKDPAERPQSATDVAEALEEIDRQLAAAAQAETQIAPPVAAPEETATFAPQIVTDDVGRPPRRPLKSAPAGRWLFGTALLTGIIFLVTSKGTVTIDIADELKDDVTVEIQDGGETVAVLSKENGWRVRLSGGQYQLNMSGGSDEFALKGDTLSVSRFGRSIVKMEYNGNADDETEESFHVPSYADSSDPSPYDLVTSGEWGWSVVEKLPAPINSTSGENSADMSADGLTIVFVSKREGGQGEADLWIATRSSTDSPWSDVRNLGPAINSEMGENHPTLSPDGRTLTFSSPRIGDRSQPFVSTRKSKTDAWSAPVPYSDLFPSTAQLKEFHSLDTTPDGQTIVLTCSGHAEDSYKPDLWMGRRGRQEDDWSDLGPIGPPINTPDREWTGTLTNDGKLLIIQREHDLWMSTRRSWDDQWSQPELIESLSTPRRENRPRLLADGKSMLFARDSENAEWKYDLYLARLVRKQSPEATAGSASSAWPADAPPPAIAPFDAGQALQHQQAWAEHLGVPVEIENSIGMKFRVIPPGEFLMGSSEEEIAKLLEEAKEQGLSLSKPYISRMQTEVPKHPVILTMPVAMGVHEVTRGHFREFVKATGYQTEAERNGKGGRGFTEEGQSAQSPEFLWNTNPGFETGQTDNHPVVNVSWNDAIAFCKWLSRKDGVLYRLPTEAEWEFACRGGTSTLFYFGNDVKPLSEFEWNQSIGGRNTWPVGKKRPNSFGLYDLAGNVKEWCKDEISAYPDRTVIDPLGEAITERRSIRGGYFGNHWLDARSAHRYSDFPDSCFAHYGFRIVRTFEKYEPPKEPKPEATSYTWPEDQPAPAIAPFTAEQARQYQEEWAEYLGVPVEREISLGQDADGNDVTPGATAGSSSSAERTLTTKTTKYALQFDGKDDYVETPVQFDVTQPLTVEAFVTVPKRPEWNQVVLCDANLGGFGLGPRENGKWRMDVQALGGQGSERDEVGYVRVEANDEMDYGRRTHVAAVYDGRIVRLYVDGRLQTQSRAVEEVVPSTLPILIGANPNPDGETTMEEFLGTIDEVRISKTPRYTADFTPAERFEPDEHTLALYHFDDAAGTTLADASGNGRNGTIHGAKWVRVEEDAPSSLGDRGYFAAIQALGGRVRFYETHVPLKAEVYAAAERDGDIWRLIDPEKLPVAADLIKAPQVFLNFSGESFGDQQLVQLARILRQRPADSFPVCLQLYTTGISPDGLAALEGIDFYTLDLIGTELTTSAISALPLSSDTSTLHVRRAKLSDDQLALLMKDSQLQGLIVSENQITGRGLQSLVRSQIWRLDVSHNALSDGDLAPLARMPGLKWLYLRGNPTTDAGLAAR